MTDHDVTAALTRMAPATRRHFRLVLRDKINDDPNNDNDLTVLWHALHNTVLDVDQAENDLIDQLEKDLRL